ncbi:MAG: maltooligosyltrehalose trehalohydrolase [Acidobacteriota bacterium]|jgi:maltooligosyltrehalose trehalohydrolase|nr:maltooligosyltrehalose trehalohydrolase [Acidobacteriota bacterium]
MKLARRLPVGAEVLPGGDGVHFRVWAPRRKRVEVVIETEGVGASIEASEGGRASIELEAEEGGYFSKLASKAGDGSLYRFRLDGEDRLYPDPVSRFQPRGPHGPSRVVDPTKFRWSDTEWRGASLKGAVIYEMHAGAFTREGTFGAAARELTELASLGVTCVELMPVSEFPGRFGWGYDGVCMYAPTHLYGEPDDLRRFVNEAHRAGVAVILDVVYNHFGPDGNYLRQFSEDYFSERHKTEWGEGINFDGETSLPVREFFLSNARYWIEEFHFDGLRLDATQSIKDGSAEHLLSALTREVRSAARGRATIIVGENEPQETRLVRTQEQGGFGLDGLWNDDFHHSASVVLNGRSEAYYSDYRGTPQEFVSSAKYGFLFQGQRYKWQRHRRGTPTFGLPPEVFINFIQNHDQVANSARGLRAHELTSPGRLRAMTALVLLAPGTPMLFMGQEFASSAPFHYFADHEAELAAKVRRGRIEFLAQFRSIASREAHARLAAPEDAETFERCKLDFTERETHRETYELHRDLLRLRRDDAVFHAQRPRGVDGAVLGTESFVLRFFGDGASEGDDRLLIVNLGRDLNLNPAPEPLLAPPAETVWTLLWSSEDWRYGGAGTPPPETKNNWCLPGHSALVMTPVPSGTVADPAGWQHGGESEEAETRREAVESWKEE